MPKKIFKGKKSGRRPRKSGAQGRRKLVKTYVPFQPVRNVARGVYHGARRAKQWATGRRAMTPYLAKQNFNNRLSADNVVNAPAFKIGKPKKLTFAEKVSRLTNPPVIHKRQYAFSAECDSGRKGWFGIPINKLNSSGSGTTGDLYDDIMNNWQRLTTDTGTQDPTINNGAQYNGAYYIDYLSERLRMVNSSSNSVKGKLTLYAYKRDCDSTFTNVNVPMTPINLMMQGSVGNLTVYGAGQEATVGNGWNFNTTTPGYDYDANYDMPGSVLNSGGATAQTDPELTIMSSHIKHFTGYYFRQVNQISFSLKPGQQIEHYSIFNDLPCIQRASQDMTYLRGVSFYLVVEFEAGIVGDATVTTGNNVISTGSGQLSCIVEEKRIISHKGRKGYKVVMPTNPLAGIALAAQYTINPDTGVADTGADQDT